MRSREGGARVRVRVRTLHLRTCLLLWAKTRGWRRIHLHVNIKAHHCTSLDTTNTLHFLNHATTLHVCAPKPTRDSCTKRHLQHNLFCNRNLLPQVFRTAFCRVVIFKKSLRSLYMCNQRVSRDENASGQGSCVGEISSDSVANRHDRKALPPGRHKIEEESYLSNGVHILAIFLYIQNLVRLIARHLHIQYFCFNRRVMSGVCSISVVTMHNRSSVANLQTQQGNSTSSRQIKNGSGK